MSLLRDRQNKAAYKRTLKQAGEDGRVCGVYDDDGNPRYFVVPADATDEQVRARAFEVKHGRPMNRAEQLLDAAQSGDFVKAYEQAMAHYYEGREGDAPTG